jgi:hypothetical protein
VIVVGMSGIALALLGACSSSGDGTSAATPSSTTLPSGFPTAVPTGTVTLPGGGNVVSGNGALNGANVPKNFPIPPGAKVEGGSTTGKESTLTLTGVDGDAAAKFYRSALPGAGYKITSDNHIPGLATAIGFEGNGVAGHIGAAGVGSAQIVGITFKKQ